MAQDHPTPEPTTAESFKVPTDNDHLITWAERKRTKGRARMPEFQMKLNLAYLLGQQDLAWDSDRGRFERPMPSKNDPNAPIRIVANKVGGIVEHYISRLVSQAPNAEVRPVGDDDKDIDASKAGTRILKSENRRLVWDTFVMEHFFWVVTHGWAYGQVMWDPSSGAKVGTVHADKPEEKDVMLGNVVIDSVPAFELSVDPDAADMRTAKWAVRTKTMTKESVWEQWGQVPQGAEPVRSIADEVYALVNAGAGKKGEQRTDTVGVHQLWMVPCRAAPKGLVVTWCGKTILEGPSDFPYNHGKLPFIQWDLLPGMGRREGRTWLDDLISLQADYNDARSREATIRRTLTPKVLAASGSMDQQKMSSRVEVLNYNPGMGDKPTMMIPDSGWMAQYESSMNRAQAEMSDRAGESSFNISRASAAAVMALQQINDTKVYVSQMLLVAAIQETSWHVLELIKQFWSEDRMVSTYSEVGTLEVAHFSGADIDHQLDIYMAVELGEKQSKAATMQLGLDLWKSGVITDPRHLLRLLKVPDASFLADEFDVDARQAQRENEYLLAGQPVQVHDFDNHDVHGIEHDIMRKSEDFEKIEEMARKGDPQATTIVAAVNAHCDLHKQMSAQQKSAQQSPETTAELVKSLDYKFTPPDIQRQIEALAGLKPSEMGMEPPPPPGTGVTPNAEEGAEVAPQGGTGPTPTDNSMQGIAARAGIGGGFGEPGIPPGATADQAASAIGR